MQAAAPTCAPKRTHLQLVEHGPAVRAFLTSEQRDALLASPAKLQLTPVPATQDVWEVRATRYVGVVLHGDLQVEIRPKLPIDRLVPLLAFANGLPKPQLDLAQLHQAPDLHEVLAQLYAQVLAKSLARGLPHDYIERDEDLPTLRGRLRFTDQLRVRPHTWSPLAVRHDEFSDDIPLNQTLKAALRTLQRLPHRDPATPRSLLRWQRVLGGVSDLAPGATRKSVTLSRLHAHLAPALELAQIILDGNSLEPESGSRSAPGFLLDLATLFERFVRASIRQSFQLRHQQLPPPERGTFHLDHANRIGLEPDLLWRTGPRVTLVGDVKYKRLEGEARQADLYQLLTYAIRAGTDRAILIHATPQSRVLHRVRTDALPLSLDVVGLNLSAPLEEVHRKLAQTIRAHLA